MKRNGLECPRCGGSGRIADPAATGRIYRRAREATGMSLRYVARRAGISATYLSQLERGVLPWTLRAQRDVGLIVVGAAQAMGILAKSSRRKP